ncbi:sigma 54-interacting transcriptional regulator [Flavobacterium sp. F52]|uniref:sigma 54-interacting transcriptional regulator n=1 Tax=Flavobacterium sp. F52 TaxID=1202532 RepID=UPI000272D863|nr:sigma 54-interacting transcriptional regulator [Flavobacterium sp. F52]EJG03170.1 Fis family sigma-54 specific transcriptional regulator [Flavobacterium sp. F52]
MSQRVLIVEDQFVEANSLEIMLEKAGYTVCGIARSAEEALVLMEKEKPKIALVDIQLAGELSGIELAESFKANNIAFIYVSANSNQQTLMKAKATQPYGFIVKPFRERDLLVTLEIAEYRHENGLETAVRKVDDFSARLNEIFAGSNDLKDKMLLTVRALQNCLSFDYLALCTNKGSFAGQLMSFLRIGYDEYQRIGLEEFQVITNLKMSEIYKKEPVEDFEQKQACYSGEGFEAAKKGHDLIGLIADTFKLKSLCLIPIVLPDGTYFKFAFYSRRSDTYNQGQNALIERLKIPLAAAVEHLLYMEMKGSSVIEELNAEEILTDEKMSSGAFDGIVGKSHLLLRVFDDMAQVAPVDTSVLILGESGTGKEKVAQGIHDASKRRENPFVKINCAAFPSSLIESELFGHEKGAFTGALERRIGKFERADKGTIFLDEIGDMPHDLQAKLLRVLQEKEIERLGGSQSIKVDVRIIAATNRNLEEEVAAGRFRLDLYYRLNIFPIILPPLRERREDIPLLAEYFIKMYNVLMGKSAAGLSEGSLNTALKYDWPGNIRELQNSVERAVLLCKEGQKIELAVGPHKGWKETVSVNESDSEFKSIDEMERDHIVNALRKCNGKVWGAGGAAELLNLPASTLSSKMKKFDIKRDFL